MTILAALEQATEAIEAPYFLLPIAGRDLPIKRERVYCYELFHQLRLALRDSQLTLTGEPDKRGHPDFPPINPDFILHTPGGHEENTAVVEVECRVGLEHLKSKIFVTSRQCGIAAMELSFSCFSPIATCLGPSLRKLPEKRTLAWARLLFYFIGHQV